MSDSVMDDYAIEIFRRITLRGRRWFIRIRAKNGRIIMSSEGHQNREDVVKLVEPLHDLRPGYIQTP